MADPRHTLGHRAEVAVASWLEACGWDILGRRLRAPGGGEVDLVALDPAGVLVAVEVRARRSRRAGEAATSVDRQRSRRLAATLASFARAAPAHAGLRVDLVTAEPSEVPGRWLLRRIPDVGAA